MSSVFLVAASAWAGAQHGPPVYGVTNAKDVDGSIDRFHRDLHRILVKSGDGVHHLIDVDDHTAVRRRVRRAEVIP